MFKASVAKGLLWGFYGLVTLMYYFVLPQIKVLFFIISVYEKARLKISVLSRRLYKWLLARISFF